MGGEGLLRQPGVLQGIWAGPAFVATMNDWYFRQYPRGGKLS